MKIIISTIAFLVSFQTYAANVFDFLPAKALRATQQAGLCSSNGLNRIGRFDPKNFNYAKAVEFIREQDAKVNVGSKDCAQNRVYSSETDGAVARLEDLLNLQIAEPMENYNEPNQICFEDENITKYIPDFIEFAKSFDNKSVISSSFVVQDGDFEHGERCAYWDFYFFRKDGLLIKWSFDHSL